MASKELAKRSTVGGPSAISSEDLLALERLTEQELIGNFCEQREVEGYAFLKQCCFVGVALGEAEHGSDQASKIAENFDLHPTRVRKMAQVYREIILRRLEKQDGVALFPISGKTFYSYAVELAPKQSKVRGEQVTALDLLEELEDKKSARAGYSTNDFLVDYTPKAGPQPPESPRNKFGSIQSALRNLVDGFEEGEFGIWIKEVNVLKEDWPFVVKSYLRIGKILEKGLPALQARMTAERKAEAEAKAEVEKARKAKAKKPKAAKKAKAKQSKAAAVLAFPKPTSKKSKRAKKGLTASQIEQGQEEE